ncbi:MAG: hypothetical protein H6581_14600 [Bacteroidia bacterium]|nr:hypothetical protein [Bacteroidia bacterium]
MRTHLFTAILLLLGMTVLAQAPQAINYQGIARDNNGNVLPNTAISIRFSILDGSTLGPSLYTETHSTSTNQFGLFTLAIGAGTVQSGAFNTINWGAAGRFLKVEMDPSGGSSYLLMGTNQFLSVPYSLYSSTAKNADQANYANTAGSATHADTANYAWLAANANHANTADYADSATHVPNPLPSGTNGQTLRYASGSWTANSILYNDGTNVGVGTSAPAAKLHVNGTARMTGFTLPTGAVNGYVLKTDASGNGTWQPATGGGVTLDGAYDFGGAGAGRIITADAGAVEINSAVSNGVGLDLNTTGANGIGLRSDLTTTGGVAIRAESYTAGNTFSTIQASTNSTSNLASAVVGNSTGAAPGVSGQVMSTATAQQAVYGSNLRTNGGHGVRGVGFNGLVGETNYRNGYAVYAENYDVNGTGNGVGVAGRGYYGVFGEDRYSGGVAGAYGVYSNGSFAATGGKSFNIDHPADPENKYLRHFSLESNEVLNMYRGTVQLDAQGEARVELPAYFQAINREFSYHLTPIGAFAQVYVKQKVQGNEFVIAGGNPGMEVSWMLIAERNDAYFQQNPDQRQVEVDKTDRDKGKYLIPALYGKPAEKGIFYRAPGGEIQPVMNMAK